MFLVLFQLGQLWVIPVTIIAALILIIWVRSQSGDRKIRKLLQSENAGPLVEFFRFKYRRALIDNQDAIFASSVGLAYALYGDFKCVRDSLNAVEWQKRPPLIQAQRIYLEALLCYFEDHNSEEGLRRARCARELAALCEFIPGARTSLATYDAYVEIGEILSQTPDQETVSSLEKKCAQLPTLARVTIAWALEIAYQRLGKEDKANRMRELRLSLAPYCFCFPATARLAD